MRIFRNMTELIGRTPLVRLERLETEAGMDAVLLAKLEGMNPAGSAKDRIALTMVLDAEEKGLLKPGGTLIEPTSGNTGIGLAAVAAARGYHAVFAMPDSMSKERRSLLKAYGAEVVLTPGTLGMQGAIDKAEELHRETPGSMIPGQFVNPANPAAHYTFTGPEIWEDTQGGVDLFIAGVGTGGTLTGVGRYLKERKPSVHVIAVEPSDSPVLSGGKPGTHKIQGIGAGFIPQTLDTAIYDEVLAIDTEDAFRAGRLLARREGILAGISSGAVLHAAMLLARRPEFKEKMIVTLLPDSGERYLSTAMFTEEG